MSQPTVQYEKNAELFADYQTPYKLNRPILAPSGKPGDFDALGVDNMRIFRHKGRFYCKEGMGLIRREQAGHAQTTMRRSLLKSRGI